jgi:hypothetical protein
MSGIYTLKDRAAQIWRFANWRNIAISLIDWWTPFSGSV